MRVFIALACYAIGREVYNAVLVPAWREHIPTMLGIVSLHGGSLFPTCWEQIDEALVLDLTYEIDAWLQGFFALLPFGGTNFAVVSGHKLCGFYLAQ